MAETKLRRSQVVRTGTLVLSDGREVSVTASTSPVVVGRDASCTIPLDDPETSAIHCEVRADPDGVVLRDLGSKNGTFVGALRVREAVLSAPCAVLVGGSSLRFEPGAREQVEISQEESFGALVGRAPCMLQVFRRLREIAPTELSVLITGETGTGKELVARALHDHSRREKKPFVVVDCGWIPPTLAESHLFGHEKGAFTGATHKTKGAFQEAAGGTLFLDEIGELPIELQPKLLRALAEKTVKRVGSATYEAVDVRIIAATLQDLGRRSNAGKFRSDLFFRLAQVRVELPPLRDRREDIGAIVAATCARIGFPKRAAEIFDILSQSMPQHEWTGNVRELTNLVRAIAELPPGAETLQALLPLAPEAEGRLAASHFGEAKRAAVGAFEQGYFTRLVAETGGNVSEMARRSGMERHHVRGFLRKLGLQGK